MILYKRDSSGKLRLWETSIHHGSEETTIITKSGLVDGKVTKKMKVVKSSQNKHHADRAKSLLANKIQRKKDSGYCVTERDALSFTSRRPMLAKTAFINEPNSIEGLLPCLSQVKLDGIRALWYPDTMTLESRKGLAWDRMAHITSVLQGTAKDLYLDGEFYKHGMPLQDIVHNVRTSASEGKQEIAYYIFDSPNRDSSVSYLDRLQAVSKWHSGLSKAQKKFIVIPPLTVVTTLKDVEESFDLAISQQYEGIMLKSMSSGYQWDKRVKELTKVKPVYTDEFKIVETFTNTRTGTPLIEFICEIPSGDFFKVVPKWDRKTRHLATGDAERWIGKLLTVEFRGFTKRKIPVHAVGISIRDYEEI